MGEPCLASLSVGWAFLPLMPGMTFAQVKVLFVGKSTLTYLSAADYTPRVLVFALVADPSPVHNGPALLHPSSEYHLNVIKSMK